jgi:hypothetical protein
VLPLLRALLAGWQPLAEPQRGAAQVGAWRPLLESEAARQAVLGHGGGGPGGGAFSGSGGGWEEGGDAYALLVAEVVLPPVR